MFKNVNNISEREHAVLKPMFDEPQRWFHLRELAAEVGLSPAGAGNYMDSFVKEGMVLEKRERKFRLLSANMASALFRAHKVFYAVSAIIRSGLFGKLKESFPGSAIIFFGECSTGADSKDSVMEIFVLSEGKAKLGLGEYERRLGRKIRLEVMGKEEFSRAKRSASGLYSRIMNGIRLEGNLEVAAP